MLFQSPHPWKPRSAVLLSIVCFLLLSAAGARAEEPGRVIGVWNSFLEQTNVVECTNLHSNAASFRLTLRNGSGAQIGEKEFQLGAEETSHIVLNEFDLGLGYGIYVIETLSGEGSGLRCLTAFYRYAPPPWATPVEYAFALAAVQTASGVTSGIFNSYNPDGSGEPVYNWLSLVNLDASQFNARLLTYDQSGVPTGSRTLSVNPGERIDLPLGHENGYRVGVYRIVPDNDAAAYSAFLTRYSKGTGQGYRFAFAVPSRKGSSAPGPVSVSTMGDALNYGEIASVSARPVEVAVDIRDQSGTAKEQRIVILKPFSQIHLYVNPYLGAESVGSIDARCLDCTAGEGILVQSMFYGRNPGGQVKWAYASTGSSIPAGSIKLAAPVNTFLKAANWEKLISGKGRPWVKSHVADASGQRKKEQAYQLADAGEIDLGLHEEVGPDFIGAAFGEFESDGENLRAELLRVYPNTGGGIGYIMNVPVSYLLRTPPASPEPREEEPNDPGQPTCTGYPQVTGGETADVTGSLLISSANEKTTLDRDRRELTSTVELTIKNTSQTPIYGPLHLVLGTGECVVMPGALGGLNVPPHNAYYFDLNEAAGEVLAPGEEITLSLTFVRPDYLFLNYQVFVFGALQPQGNRAPLISVLPRQKNVAQGEQVTVQVTATDPDGDAVTIAASPKIENASFRATAGTNGQASFTFTASETQAGKFVVSFTARDPEGASAGDTAEITVTGINRAPVLTAPEGVQGKEGELISFTVTASDPDNDVLNVTAAGLPENAIFVPATNTFSFIPNYEQAGTYEIVFEAADGALSSGQKSVTVTVINVDPEQQGQIPAILTLEVDPVQNPTLLKSQRITGRVNEAGTAPVAPPVVSALITGLTPATARQGQTLDVTITGQTTGSFPTHFAQGASAPDFGPDITVNTVTVNSGTQLTANISVSPSAPPGIRSVLVLTGSEVAVSLVAFRVEPGEAAIHGILQDPDTHLPLGDAIITIQGTNLTVHTAPDGSFTLNNVPAGSQILLINAPDHKFFTVSLDVQTGMTVDLGTIGSPATVYTAGSPDAVSAVSVLGRGAGASIVNLNKEQAKQLIIDTILLLGNDELGVLDDYGQQLNPEIAGTGAISLTGEGLDVLADRLLRDQSVRLVDLLFSVSYGYKWGGSRGTALTLDEWLSAMQTLVNQAWADQSDPDSLFALIVFNTGRTLSPEPPTLTPLTTLNALQAFLLTASLLKEMEWRINNQVTELHCGERNAMLALLSHTAEKIEKLLVQDAYAQPSPSGRYTRFWRQCFKNDTYPKLILAQGTEIYARDSTFILVASSTGLAGTMASTIVAGMMVDAMHNMIMALQTAARVPEAPKIVAVTKSASGLHFQFDPVDARSNVFTLMHFENMDAKPRIIDMGFSAKSLTNQHAVNPGIIKEAMLHDANPPTKGTGFYAMTGTWIRKNVDNLTEAGMSKWVVAPWWGVPTSNPGPEDNSRYSYLAYWLNMQSSVYTSNYSEPFIYVADKLPDLGAIDTLVVDGSNDDVYVSNIPLKQIIKVKKEYGSLGDKTVFAETNFASPGQKGLAIDWGRSLYADNGASDSLYGGRLFRFTQWNTREFCGTVNYFSQLLMSANPVLVASMVMGQDNQLYVFDRLNRQLKRVPVNQTWDPYRRVGQPIFTLPPDWDGNVIDLEFPSAETPVIHILDSSGITRLQVMTIGGAVWDGRTSLE